MEEISAVEHIVVVAVMGRTHLVSRMQDVRNEGAPIVGAQTGDVRIASGPIVVVLTSVTDILQ